MLILSPLVRKSWHASYNRWLVRYLYVPLGGSRTRTFNVWVVFSFVALWHDPDPRLLVSGMYAAHGRLRATFRQGLYLQLCNYLPGTSQRWGWLMALFLMPEMGLKWLAQTPVMRKWHETTIYRLVSTSSTAGPSFEDSGDATGWQRSNKARLRLRPTQD